MCGLAGVAALGGGDLRAGIETVLAGMARAVGHRGPDAERVLIDGPVGLAFRRLALIGPESAGQPLFSADENVVLIANGEVYNHRELEVRNRMRLRTNSDCEVLAHLYAEHGPRFLDDVVGMYSIVLWDRRANRLVLARDRFGIKPLYYTLTADAVVFASEIKGIFAHPDSTRELDWVGALSDQSMTIASHLTDEPVRTWFRGVHSVPAGAIVTIDLGTGRSDQHNYWRLPSFNGTSDASDDEFIDAYRRLLSSAVSDTANADAELGIFLSGGVDSAAVAALAVAGKGSSFHTFTVLSGSTVTNGDAEYGHRMARMLGLPNHQLAFDADAVPGVDEWKRLLWQLETPLCTAEQFYKFELYRLAKQVRPELRGMLLGAGSDEFNGGFSTVFCLEPDWAGFEAGVRQLARSAALLRRPQLARWWEHAESPLLDDALLHDVAVDIIADPYTAYVSWRYRQMQQYNTWHEDRTAAGNGIEARVPFLDHRIIELLAQIPADRRASLLWDKRILRDAVRNLLPAAVADRPKVPFYFGDGVGSAQRTMVRMLARSEDALLEEALASPGGRQYLRPVALRAMLRRLETEAEPWDFEYLLRLVNLGLLDNMTHELPLSPLETPSVRIVADTHVADWDREGSELVARLRPRSTPNVDDVLGLTEGVLVVHPPDNPERLYVTVHGAFEFIAERDEDAAWWAFLRAVDGKRTLGELLSAASTDQAAIAGTLTEALDARVLTVVGK